MATKYEVVLRKCRQEPCVKILVVICCATCMKVSTNNIYKFGMYNRCKNVIATSGLPKLEALYNMCMYVHVFH